MDCREITLTQIILYGLQGDHPDKNNPLLIAVRSWIKQYLYNTKSMA
jgi:hypothetical protein